MTGRPDIARPTNHADRVPWQSSLSRVISLVILVTICSIAHTADAQVELIVRTQTTAIDLANTLGDPTVLGKTQDAVLRNVNSATALLSVPTRPNQASSPLTRAFRLSYADSASAAQALTQLGTDARIELVQWNRVYQLDTDAAEFNEAGHRTVQPSKGLDLDGRRDDPHADSLDHFDVIGVPGAWAVSRGDSTVTVGVIDTGSFFGHPDLRGQYRINAAEDLNNNGLLDAGDLNGLDDDGNGFVDDVIGYDFVDQPFNVEAGDFRQRDNDPSDDGSGHGTIVAGVIAAAADNGVGIAGIAPGVRLLTLRAFGRDGRGEDDDISAAIVYAADNGVDVLNLSFGDSYYSPLMHESIRYAASKGVVVVASAGNVGGDDPHYPSDYPEVISTVWLDASGNGPAGRATHGIGIDLGAPGSQVYTTLMPTDALSSKDTDLYGRQSGSSMAAPMVTAAAALLRSVSSGLSPESVRAILKSTATDIGDAGIDHRTGAGRLNVAAALIRGLPAEVSILTPEEFEGISTSDVVITGTVVNPLLRSYTLAYAVGDENLTESSFTEIGSEATGQVVRDTLAVWNVASLPDGLYTLRLRAQTGATFQHTQRRIFIDRTDSQLKVHRLQSAVSTGLSAVFADVATDDETTARLEVTHGAKTTTVHSDRISTRHGMVWHNDDRVRGSVSARVVVTNRTGAETESEPRTIVLPNILPDQIGMERQRTRLRHGYPLPSLVDFDNDGLPEIVYNAYANGWLGDTLRFAEFGAGEFRVTGELIANIFPRDVGDTDADGRLELLGQTSAATVLLEQGSAAEIPNTPIFVDTTGLSNPTDPEAVWGARLSDVDGDTRGEILSHNTSSVRILENGGASFSVAAVLPNPTGVSGELPENSFQQPEMLVGDFDADGLRDFVVGDSDGDWIIFEARGNDSYIPVWTYETELYNAGARLAAGDVDGDGAPELVLTATNWNGETAEGIYEPGVTQLYIFDNTGDDNYALVDSLALPGAVSQHNGITTADLDNDGRDEIVVVVAPHLYVLSHNNGWSVVYHLPPTIGDSSSGSRSAKIVSGDLDGNGVIDLIIGGIDGYFHRLEPIIPSLQPGPQWVSHYPFSTTSGLLRWAAPAADSVVIYRSIGNAPFESDSTVVNSDSAVVQLDAATAFFARAWINGTLSSASPIVTLVGHEPARALTATVIDQYHIAVSFTFPMLVPESMYLFRLRDNEGIRSPEAAIASSNGNAIVLRFRHPVTTGTLEWSGLRSVDGAPSIDAAINITQPAASSPFHVDSWEILDERSIVITFSAAVDISTATELTNYVVHPFGAVSFVAATNDPATVNVDVSGIALGATGLNATMTLSGIRSTDGHVLNTTGNVIGLSPVATSLASAFVFPNPARVESDHITIGGLPAGTNIEVLSPNGSTLKRLTEGNGTGGVTWDLRNERGEIVPSGVYLVRVSVTGQKPRLLKAAIIR